MAQYALITLNVKDTEKLAEYLAVAAPAVAKHKGRPVVKGAEAVSLQSPHGITKGVVLEFPTPEDVTNWLEDPELADIHALRNAAADVTIISMPAL